MAQTRRRIFIVMVREDICDETFAEQLSRVITDVLPHALYNEHGGPHYRETIQDLMKYNRSVLEVMGKEPTLPPISQDRVDHFLLFQNQSFISGVAWGCQMWSSGWAHTDNSNLTVYHSQPLFLRSWIPVSEIPWIFTMLCFRWHGRKIVGWEGGGRGDIKRIDSGFWMMIERLRLRLIQILILMFDFDSVHICCI